MTRKVAGLARRVHRECRASRRRLTVVHTLALTAVAGLALAPLLRPLCRPYLNPWGAPLATASCCAPRTAQQPGHAGSGSTAGLPCCEAEAAPAPACCAGPPEPGAVSGPHLMIPAYRGPCPVCQATKSYAWGCAEFTVPGSGRPGPASSRMAPPAQPVRAHTLTYRLTCRDPPAA